MNDRIELSPKIISKRSGEYSHYCPGCGILHTFNINKHNRNGLHYTYNEKPEAPTFYPNKLVIVKRYKVALVEVEEPNDNNAISFNDKTPYVLETSCNYWLMRGKITYSVHCLHRLAGKTIDLPNIPDVFFK